MLRSVDLSAYFDDGFSLSTLPPPDLAARTASLCLPRTSAVSDFSDSGGLCLSLPPASTALRRMGPSGTWAECPQRPSKAARGTHADLVTLLHEAVRRCYAAEDSAKSHCERFRDPCRGEDSGHSGEISSSSEFAYALAGIRAQRWRRGEEVRRAGDAARDALRAKELPQLVEDAVRYAQQLITGGGRGGSSAGSAGSAVMMDETAPLSLGLFPVDQMLYTRFPPPLFRTAPFSAGVARLLRWLCTWHEPIDGANGHSYHDAWLRIAQSDSIPHHNPISLSGPADVDSAAYYDEFGNCLRSARLARKMADQRAVEAEAEAARARRRGYFSRAGEALSGRLPGRRAGLDEGISHGNSSGSDDASDASDEDVTNIAVLHGPCGVGKTAAVYLAAAVLGYRVVEMNTSVRRCPKNIDRLLAELTRSRRLSGRAGSGKAMVSIEEELKKLKSEHAVAQQSRSRSQSQSQSQSPATSKGKGGGKANKGNAISAAAVAAFFKPRSVPVEVIDVDGVKEKPAEAAPAKTDSKVNSHGTRKRLREGTNIDTSEVTSAGVTTATTVSTTTSSSGTPVLPISNNNNNNNNNSGAAAGGGGGGVDDDADGRTLLLFEDADVILADEAIRPFYAAVRDLAHRSKVPIVVTVSSGAAAPSEHRTSMGAAQAAQYFGKQTPFTGMGSMPRSALVAQLLVVAAVERGLLLACSCAPSSSCTSLSCVTVTDAEAFRRISDALREEVYSATDGTHIDVRMWLNRLQCLLLCEQWPGTHELHEKYTNDCDNDGGDGEDAGVESPVSWLMPTRAAIALEDDNAESNALARSEWDARRGRALCFGSSPVASPWEWTHFHYAEEITTRGWSTSNGSSSNSNSSGIGMNINNNMNMNTTNTYSSTTSSSSPCSVGIGSCAAAEARSSAVGANTDASSCAVPCAAVPPALSVNDGALLADDLPATLRERAERSSVDGETVQLGGGFTTRDRIERFGYWWRRTRRSDATRLFVAGRSGRAYEDIIGFGSLLQPVSTGKSA